MTIVGGWRLDVWAVDYNLRVLSNLQPPTLNSQQTTTAQIAVVHPAQYFETAIFI